MAEALHFRRAAEALQTAQPSLSQQIRALEKELGVLLLERTKRSVRLTSAGSVYASAIKRVLADLDTAGRHALQAQHGARGDLIIGAYSALVASEFPAVIGAFRTAYPEVRVQIRLMHRTEIIQELRSRHIHLGFMQPPAEEETLLAEFLWEYPFSLALPAGHRLASSARLELKDLNGEVLLAHARTSSAALYDSIISICQQHHFVPGSVEQVADSQSIIGLVACGYGVAIVPAHWQSFAHPRVLFRTLPNDVIRQRVAACWHRDETSPIIPAFLAVARSVGVARPASPLVHETETS